jgi:aldehyde:ferredoxin oxidoreductase
VTADPDVWGTARLGTAGIVLSQDQAGGLPTRNWQSGALGQELAAGISGELLFETMLKGAADGTQLKDGRDTCYSCAVRCKRVVDSEFEGKPINPESGGPEYEGISTLGSYNGVSDMRAVAYANQVCNEYGVDSISAGATVAFAMECFEKGLITAADTDGIELRWGDGAAMVAMLERTLKREGFGDILAEGSHRAAERIGKGAERFVMASKKQEAPAHMPQVKGSMAIIYAVNPYGADHQSSEHDPFYEADAFKRRPEKYQARMNEIGLFDPQTSRAINQAKAQYGLHTQYTYGALSSSAVCAFVYGPAWQLMSVGELAQVHAAVTGWPIGVEELLLVGRRTVNMQRAFNMREGFTKEQDTLPRRFHDEPLKGGTSDGWYVPEDDWKAARDAYYRLAEWDPATGNPTRDTFEKLDLAWVADLVGA